MSDIDPAVFDSEVVQSISEQIAQRVSHVRALESHIQAVREEHGVISAEDSIKQLRAELLELTRDYHDITGSNWSDDTNRVLYVQAGESHRFDTRKVDEALAGLLGIQRDMEAVLSDTPSQFLIVLGEEKVLVKAEDLAAAAFGKDAALAFLAKAEETRLVAMRELMLRAEAMDVMLKNLAAARSVTATVEHVSISKNSAKSE